MKLVALVSFYDELSQELARCLSGLHRLNVTDVIAVDGAYMQFPDPSGTSPGACHAALTTAASGLGMNLTLITRANPWISEVAKRSYLHWLADELYGSPLDEPYWQLVMDADEVVCDPVPDIIDRLAVTKRDLAVVSTLESGGAFGTMPRLFRGGLGVYLTDNHHTYMTATGVPLWRGHDHHPPALDLTDVIVSHRPQLRTAERDERKRAYYRLRTEIIQCERCERQGTQRVLTNWRIMNDELLSDPIDVCQWCAEDERKHGRQVLVALGVNPDRVTVG